MTPVLSFTPFKMAVITRFRQPRVSQESQQRIQTGAGGGVGVGSDQEGGGGGQESQCEKQFFKNETISTERSVLIDGGEKANCIQRNVYPPPPHHPTAFLPAF